MNLQEFCQARPFLYHLTDATNLNLILESGILLSTERIVERALTNERERRNFLREKRNNHIILSVNGVNYKIRDQNPISIKVLERSLSDNLDVGDFIEMLNERVFWWPTLDRLSRHYDRYEAENPVILKVNSSDLLELNENVEFCHLNSGATRCHPYYGGNAPTRGRDSFLNPELYDKEISSVAEVTFVGECALPQIIWTGNNPNGDWQQV